MYLYIFSDEEHKSIDVMELQCLGACADIDMGETGKYTVDIEYVVRFPDFRNFWWWLLAKTVKICTNEKQIKQLKAT